MKGLTLLVVLSYSIATYSLDVSPPGWLPSKVASNVDVFKKALVSQFILDCENDILIMTPETSQDYLYHAANSINVTNGYRIEANSGYNITMKAGKNIVIKPNTAVLRGNSYLARIEDCHESCESSYEYDKFFTPNEDGVNDYWNVRNLKNIFNAKIFIYNRYGKLLQIIKPNTPGWNGNYNSIQMFGNDYWFLMIYEDCKGNTREIKSHFSLLR